MAKKEAAAADSIKFEVPDDVFGPDGEVDSDSEPISTSEDDPADDAEDKEAPVEKEKPVRVAAKPVDDEEPDLPPSEPPSDPAYLLAEERARRLELEQRLMAIEEGAKKRPVDEDAEADRALEDKKRSARAKAMQAARTGDEAERQEAMWELGDLEREEYRRDSARQLRDLRQSREGGDRPTQPVVSPQQRQAIEAETFRAAYRVTSEEERRMESEWAKFSAKNPAWNGARTWTKFDKALRLVRKAGTGWATANLVEGGQGAPAGKGRLENKSRLELGARLFGVSQEEYKKVVSAHAKRGR